MFEFTKIYTRKMIELKIDPQRTKTISRNSYYAVNDKDGNKLEKLVFMTNKSPYKNKIINENIIEWQDSVNTFVGTGVKFLIWHKPIFFFKELTTKKGHYKLVGELEKFSQITNNIKQINTFHIFFKNHIPEDVKILFDDTEKSEIKKINSFENKFNINRIDAEEMKKIGRIGEEIFYNHLTNEALSYKNIIKLLKKIAPTTFLEQDFNFEWKNQDEESGLSYDFIVCGKKIDIKTSKIKLNLFHISASQYKLIQNGELIIVNILLDSEKKFKKIKVLSSDFLLKKFNFITENYLVLLK